MDIWFLMGIGESWSAPHHGGTTPNSPRNDDEISLTNDGALYFASSRDAGDVDSNLDPYKAESDERDWLKPQPLPGKVTEKK